MAAIPAYWRHLCGADYAVIEPFLQSTDIPGATYPCVGCASRDCVRDIVDYGDGEILAVCQNEWRKQPDIPLKLSDTLLRQVDLTDFTRAIARPLGVRWQAPVEKGHGAWGMGLWTNEHGIERQVVLMLHAELDRFQNALHRLLAESPEQFILLAPTNRHKDLAVHGTLARRDISFQTLDACLGIDDAGRFATLQPGQFPFAAAEPPIEPTPVAERPGRVAAFCAKYGMTIKAILVTLNVDRRDFNRWRNGALSNTSSKSKKIDAYLRSAPSTKVWPR
jgi:hypothetical protein